MSAYAMGAIASAFCCGICAKTVIGNSSRGQPVGWWLLLAFLNGALAIMQAMRA